MLLRWDRLSGLRFIHREDCRVLGSLGRGSTVGHSSRMDGGYKCWITETHI